MNHCVGKILLGLFSLLPVLVVGGCDSSTSPSAGQTGGASGGTPETGGAPGMAGSTGGSPVQTGGASSATGGTPGMAGNTGAAGAAAGASSAGETASAGVTASAGAIAGATESGGKSAGGTSAGGKTGLAGATGSSGGAITSGGVTNPGGATTSGGVTGSAGGGKNTGGTAVAGNSGSAGATGSGGTKPTGGTTPTAGATSSGGTKPTGGTTSAGGTTASSANDSGPTGTPVGVHGQLKVAGNKIVDKNGNPVTLHGMSMYDWSQQGRQFYNASAVGHLAKDFDCAILRVPILPQNATSGLSRLEAVLDAAIANGIYAIIDWHGGGASQQATAAAFFGSMSAKYGNNPNIMYEPWNEPTVAWSIVKTYHEAVIAAIRANDPDKIIFLGTPQWDQKPDTAAADPVTTSTNLAYVVHFYANSHPLAGFQKAITTTLNAGLAIFVTEYGGCSANGSGTFNATELQKWWTFLDANDIGCTNWAVETNGETSSIFKTNAAANGPWTTADLTDPDGTTIISYIQSKYAATLTSP